MARGRTYVLTATRRLQILGMKKARGRNIEEIICKKCEKTINIGQECTSSGHPTNTSHYHKSCAEAVNII